MPMFNVGVEAGQLVFVALALGVKFLLQRLPLRWPGWTAQIAPYSIGVVAMFWVIERVGSFWR